MHDVQPKPTSVCAKCEAYFHDCPTISRYTCPYDEQNLPHSGEQERIKDREDCRLV